MVASGILNKIDFNILASIGNINAAHEDDIKIADRVMEFFYKLFTVEGTPNTIYDIHNQKVEFSNLLYNAVSNYQKTAEKYESYCKLIVK